MKKSLVIALNCLTPLITLASCPALAIDAKDNSLAAELDALVPRLLKQQGVPGVSIAVIKGGQVVWSKGYGLADTTKGTPVKQDTRFNIGSVSKTLTAWAVMSLVEKGSVELDAPVDRYLRRWHLPESQFGNDKLTVRQLLSHTSGLSVYPMGASINGHLPGEKLPKLEEALSRSYGSFGSLRLVREPGKSFEYNNGNYAVLQLLVEDVTGKSFADYMQSRVFKPLGMSHTGYEWTRQPQSSVATPYKQDGEAWPHYQFVERGSGGVYTTATDLAKLVAAIASANIKSTRRILKPGTVQQMITPGAGTGGRYGFGYKMFPVSKELQLISHDGSNEGWRAIFLMHPQKGDGIVLLTNSDAGGKVGPPIICTVFARTTMDMSPLCSSVPR